MGAVIAEYEIVRTSLASAMDRQQRRVDALTLVVSLLVTVSVGFLAAAVGDPCDPLGWRITASALTVVGLGAAVVMLFRNALVFPEPKALLDKWRKESLDAPALQAEQLKDLTGAWERNRGTVRTYIWLGGVSSFASLVSVGISIYLLLRSAA